MTFLDYNSTSPLRPDVLDAMMPYLTTEWGNPSSSYRFGSTLKPAIEAARGHLAALIGASSSELIFTSGATESNNAAIHAAVKANLNNRHIVTSAVEHSSVLNYFRALEKDGYRTTYLPVDREGLISLDNLRQAIAADTAVVSLMWANNETGVLFPVEDIADICRSRGISYHCDAVQAVGKTRVDLSVLGADYVSLSGHKLGAPKGIGALYVRQHSPFTPLIYGGEQERSLRGGTENVPYIVGIGKAAAIAQQNLPHYETYVRRLRDMLEHELLNSITGAELNGHGTKRLPNTTNIRFAGLDNAAVLALLDQNGICASSGSACMDSALTPSHVISAMTHSRKHAEESIRFSLGAANTEDEVKAVVSHLQEIARLLR